MAQLTAQLPDPRFSRAYLVGVSQYAKAPALSPLPAVVNNLEGLYTVLTRADRSGFMPDHCVVSAGPASLGDVGATMRELAWVSYDTFLFYFAGHGLVDDNGELVLALGDTDLNDPKFTGLSLEWIRTQIRGIRATRRILIFDCCFSGRAIGLVADPTPRATGELEIDGNYVLASAARDAVAMAPVGAKYTAFTGELLRVLAGGIADGPDLLRLCDIYEEIREALVRQGHPTPQQGGTNQILELPLVRNAMRIATSHIPMPTPVPVAPAAVSLPGWLAPVPSSWPRFLMGRNLVTNREFAEFLRDPDNAGWRIEGRHAQDLADSYYLHHWERAGSPPRELADHPVVNVCLEAARAYASWASTRWDRPLRLPSHREWETAARAGRLGDYAADEFDKGRVNCRATAGKLTRVDAFDANDYGIHDLLGNAYDLCIGDEDDGLADGEALICGGAFATPPDQLTSVRTIRPDACRWDVGFRCVHGLSTD